MRCQREGGLSAITRVKVLSPEIFIIAQGQGFHDLEASISTCDKGEYVEACRGLSPWQVISLFTLELGRTMPFPIEVSDKLERRGGGMAAW